MHTAPCFAQYLLEHAYSFCSSLNNSLRVHPTGRPGGRLAVCIRKRMKTQQCNRSKKKKQCSLANKRLLHICAPVCAPVSVEACVFGWVRVSIYVLQSEMWFPLGRCQWCGWRTQTGRDEERLLILQWVYSKFTFLYLFITIDPQHA